MKQSVLMTIGFLVCLSGCSKQPDSRYVAAPDFTEENFSRIQAGMTLHEVLAFLGHLCLFLALFYVLRGSVIGSTY